VSARGRSLVVATLLAVGLLFGPVARAVTPHPSRQPAISSVGNGVATSGATVSNPARVHHPSRRRTIGRVLGIAAVVLLLVAWTEGYGLLGGRLPTLAAPLRDTRAATRARRQAAAAARTARGRRRVPTPEPAPTAPDPDQPAPPPRPNGARS